MPRCACSSPTTGGRAAPSCCPTRTRRPASRLPRARDRGAGWPSIRDRLVVVDEAYVDFGGESAVPLVARHDNLLVVQTLSKSRSLAGLRVGFAIGQRPLIEALERVKDSFNSYPLDRLAIAGAVAALEDEAWFQETRAAHHRQPRIAGRARFRARLRGAAVAGELRVRAPSRPRGAELAAGLRERGVLVRHFRSRASRISCASPSARTTMRSPDRGAAPFNLKQHRRP